jgi:hypothetical protein
VWPLSASLDLGEIEEVEAPLSKVVVPLPKFSAVKATKEKDSVFITQICIGADKLVGHYGRTEHKACLNQIHNSLVFEVAGIMYPPRPVLEAPATGGSKKRKAAAAAETEAAPEKKTAPKKRKQVSHSEEKTSAMEKALTKPLKSSEKLVLMGPQGRSSCLRVAEKAASIKS